MADNPWGPKDDGAVGLPSIGPGMNKRRPMANKPYEKPGRLGMEDGNTAKDEKLLEKIRKRMERCIGAEAERRKTQLAAQKFGAGEQWSQADANDRNVQQRPCLTVDRLGPIIRQVVNDQRLNRPTINVSPVGDRGDPEAAKMFKGLIRAIERECGADIAYDTAFESAVRIGEGYFKFNTEWESETSMNQVIVVERIRNRFTIYGDPDSKQPDGADWKYAFESEMIQIDQYKAEYPKADVTNFTQAGSGDKFQAWFTKEHVRIAVYWEVEKKERTLVRLSNGHVGCKDELHEDVQSAIESGKLEILEERESHDRQVRWYKTNGVQIIDRGDWLGKWIPIVQVVGNEIDLEGKLKLSGLIEPAMDAQRMYNYWITKYAEAVALAPMAPFVMAEGQDEGYEDEWRNANKVPYAVIHYRPTSFAGTNLPAPQRSPMPGIPEGFQNGAQTAAMDIMATTGVHIDLAAEQNSPDMRSGKAIREYRKPQDLGSAHYLDNYCRSLKHAGAIWIDLIPKVYDEQRQLVILREDDTEQKIEIDPHASKATGERMQGQTKLATFNPTIGKYGVTVTIGPDYATKRIENREDMLSLLQAIPHIGQAAADLIVKNFDFEDAETLTRRLAMALPPEALMPAAKDMKPEQQALVQKMQQQIQTLTQQLQLAAKELQEKGADRQIAQSKIDHDFEAKLLGIIQKASAEAAKIAAETARTHLEATKVSHGAHMDERRQDHAEAQPPKETKK